MRRVLVMFALFLSIAPVTNSQPVDLNGVWKINHEKSYFAGDHPPPEYVLNLTVKLKGDSLSLAIQADHAGDATFVLPRSNSTLELTIDGSIHHTTVPAPIPGLPSADLAVSCVWQGGTLFIRESGTGFGGVTKSERRYFLSEDKAELIELVESHSTFGDVEQRLVFERQP